jgi:hypothetical protein
VLLGGIRNRDPKNKAAAEKSLRLRSHRGRIKADSHIACRVHAAPMPFPCRPPAMPFVNSHIPCRAPALLRPCRVLRECSHGSRKYPNCQSRSLTERLFCSVLLLLYSSSMINAIWFHSGHLHLRSVCY